MRKKRIAFMVAVLLFVFQTGCNKHADDTTDAHETYQIQETVDLSFFEEPVPTETTGAERTISDIYDTQITVNGDTVLAELYAGSWTLTETGEKYAALVNSITEKAIVGPDIKYAVDFDMDKTDACAEIMEEAGLQGCVIISDPYGGIEVICNYPAFEDYATTGQFIGSTAKLLVSTAMLDYDAPLTYQDPGFYRADGIWFGNHDLDEDMTAYVSPKQRTLTSAFVVSSNAYFMHALCELLPFDNVIDAYNKYYAFNGIGNPEAGYTYPNDWTTIVQPDMENIRDNTLRIAQSAIGLCDLLKVSPLYLNAVTGAIASDHMYQLHIKKDATDQIVEHTIPLSDEHRQIMWSLMDQCAQGTSSTAFAPLDGYTFYIKTGTADTKVGDDGYIKRLLITGFLAKDGVPEKVITLFVYNGVESGYVYASSLSSFYRNLASVALS